LVTWMQVLDCAIGAFWTLYEKRKYLISRSFVVVFSKFLHFVEPD
jgi:hypothetical protein